MREVVGVETDAEEIGRDKAELRRLNPDQTKNDAVDGGDKPAVPELLADQHSGDDRENAGDVVEPKHVLAKIMEWGGFGDWPDGQFWRRIKRQDEHMKAEPCRHKGCIEEVVFSAGVVL